MAVARPIPVRAPVMRTTLFFMGSSFFSLRNLLGMVVGPGSDFAPETGIVVKFNRVEPRLDVFASLALLPDVSGKQRERFGVAVWSALFHVSGPGFNFPRPARDFGMRPHPFEDFSVAFSFSQFLQKSFGIETKKPDKVLVRAGIVFVFAIFLGEGRSALV